MKISLAAAQEYVPEWRGNRDLPVEEQIKVTYRLMTAEQEEQFASTMRFIQGDESAIDVKAKVVPIWDACVTAVNGIVDENDKPVLTPKDVRNIPGIYGLITEVVAVIKQGLTEDELKN